MNFTVNTASKTFRLSATVSLFIFGAIVGATYTHSWDGPSSTPPNNNVPIPINVGSASQIKTGASAVNGFSNSGSSYIVGNLGVGVASPVQKLQVNGYTRATGFCINTSCITSWPTAGSYGASAATGYAATPSGNSVTCPAGRVMTGVNPVGSGSTNVGMRCTVLNP